VVRGLPEAREGLNPRGRRACCRPSRSCDTDSFGATCGSLLGAYFGPGRLDERWLRPFRDTIHLGLAQFYERSLSALAREMGRLPGLVAAELRDGPRTRPELVVDPGSAADSV
jgi:hypothetical protein